MESHHSTLVNSPELQENSKENEGVSDNNTNKKRSRPSTTDNLNYAPHKASFDLPDPSSSPSQSPLHSSPSSSSFHPQQFSSSHSLKTLNSPSSLFLIDDTTTQSTRSPLDSYPNNAETHMYHRWRNNGTSPKCRHPGKVTYQSFLLVCSFTFITESLKKGKIKEEEPTYARTYYDCASKKATGCLAKKWHTNIPNLYIAFENVHNHPPPPKPPTDIATKQRAIDQLKAGAKPGKVYREAVANATKPQDIPNMSQIYSWKHALTHAKDAGKIFAIFSML
jgi:hypothetical protein